MPNNPSSTVLKAVPNAGDDTIARLLMRNAREYGNDIAMREKDRGIWREVTWSAYAEEVLRCAAGFMALGVKPGDAVIILGDNRVRLYAGMTAMSMLRAYAMPAYPGATLDELKHFFGEAHVVAALVEDQEQVDKILELRDVWNVGGIYRLR
jgi:Long-chain acyl-CoA synthetases (AMP-forming)